MVPSPCQCPGVSGEVCNRFLPAEDNAPHQLVILAIAVRISTIGQMMSADVYLAKLCPA